MATTKAFEIGDLGTNLQVDASGNVTAFEITTSEVDEGTNLYYTDARARSAISVSGNLTYDSGTGVLGFTMPTTIASLSNHDTDDLAEGTTNLYFTSARARASISGGTGITYSSSTGQAELTASGVTAGSYGNASNVPQITVDTYGRITSVSDVLIAGVDNVSYNTSTGQITVETSSGADYTVDLGIGTSDSPSFSGLTVNGNLSVTGSTSGISLNDLDDVPDSILSTNTYTGDGTTAAFTLATTPSNENQLFVSVNGVFFTSGEYSLASNILTFNTAPANGDQIEVRVLDYAPGSLTIDGATSLTELTDVDTQTVAPVDGDVLVWDASSAKFLPGPADSTTLDGLDSTQFVRSDANDTISGNLTISGTTTYTGDVYLGSSDSYWDASRTTTNIHWLNNDTRGVWVGFSSDEVNDEFAVGVDSSGRFAIYNETNGRYELTVKQNGYIGIGNNTDPSRLLDVSGDSYIRGDLQVGGTVNPNLYGTLQVIQNVNNDGAGIGVLSASSGRSLRLWVDETESYIYSGGGGTQVLNINGTGTTKFAGRTNFNNIASFNSDIKFDSNGNNFGIESDSQRDSFYWNRNTTNYWKIIHNTDPTVLNFEPASGASNDIRINNNRIITTADANRTNASFTATQGQTTFTTTYTVGSVDVFLNGVKLATSDFTASNGTSIVLAEAAQAGDVIEVNSYGYVAIAGSLTNSGTQTISGSLAASTAVSAGSTSIPSLTSLYVEGGLGITEVAINSVDANPDILFQQAGTNRAGILWDRSIDGFSLSVDSTGADVYGQKQIEIFDSQVKVNTQLTVTGGSDDVTSIVNGSSPAIKVETGAIWIAHDEATILFDEGQKSITSNDSGGNFHIRCGSGDDQTHISSASGSSGLAILTMNTDGSDGSLHLGVGPQRAAGEAAIFSQSLNMSTNGVYVGTPSGNDVYGSGISLNTEHQLAKGNIPYGDYLCKAWASWNQQGTQAFHDSVNFSSVTDYGAGYSYLTFARAMANDDYAVATTENPNGDNGSSGGVDAYTTGGNGTAGSTTRVYFDFRSYSNASSDKRYVAAIIYGTG
jgi:hypothetical protein